MDNLELLSAQIELLYSGGGLPPITTVCPRPYERSVRWEAGGYSYALNLPYFSSTRERISQDLIALRVYVYTLMHPGQVTSANSPFLGLNISVRRLLMFHGNVDQATVARLSELIEQGVRLHNRRDFDNDYTQLLSRLRPRSAPFYDEGETPAPTYQTYQTYQGTVAGYPTYAIEADERGRVIGHYEQRVSGEWIATPKKRERRMGNTFHKV